jgi:hypothetical protein
VSARAAFETLGLGTSSGVQATLRAWVEPSAVKRPKDPGPLCSALGMLRIYAAGRADDPLGRERLHERELLLERRGSGVVVIAKDGEQIFRRAYGFANLGDRAPNQEDTRFNLVHHSGRLLSRVAIDQRHMSFPDEPKCFECVETPRAGALLR